MSNKEWAVAVPVSGVIYLLVDAETAEEAIEKGLNGRAWPDTPDEWTAHESLIRGNVCYADCTEASAEEN